MRRNLFLAFLLVGLVVFFFNSSFSQKDKESSKTKASPRTSSSQDVFGKPDTCRLLYLQEEKSEKAKLSVSLFNDEKLACINLPLRFGTGKTPIVCDSVSFADTRVEYFQLKLARIDTVNQTVLIGLFAYFSDPKPPLAEGDGEVANLYFTLTEQANLEEIVIDTTFIPPSNILGVATPEVKQFTPVLRVSKNMVKDIDKYEPKKKE